MAGYDHAAIELKWQDRWHAERTFYVDEESGRSKFYNLQMYPYPSGDLHMGHIRNYSYTDLLTRYLKKLRVRRLRLTDFSPSKRTIERADVDKVVTEFRTFLLDGLAAEEDELPVVELG